MGLHSGTSLSRPSTFYGSYERLNKHHSFGRHWVIFPDLPMFRVWCIWDFSKILSRYMNLSISKFVLPLIVLFQATIPCAPFAKETVRCKRVFVLTELVLARVHVNDCTLEYLYCNYEISGLPILEVTGRQYKMSKSASDAWLRLNGACKRICFMKPQHCEATCL